MKSGSTVKPKGSLHDMSMSDGKSKAGGHKNNGVYNNQGTGVGSPGGKATKAVKKRSPY